MRNSPLDPSLMAMLRGNMIKSGVEPFTNLFPSIHDLNNNCIVIIIILIILILFKEDIMKNDFMKGIFK